MERGRKVMIEIYPRPGYHESMKNQSKTISSRYFRPTFIIILVAFAITGLLSCGTPKRELTDKAYRENFYAAANRDWLAKNPTPPAGYSIWTAFTELERDNEDRIATMLDELAAHPQAKGSKEQKLADLYGAAINVARRNADGVAPVAKYIARYERAKTIGELMDADIATFNETGTACLLSFQLQSGDDGTPFFVHTGPRPINADVYRNGKAKRAYIKYLTTLFTLAGNSLHEAGNRAKTVYAFEADLASVALSADKLINPDNVISYPFYLFRTMYPSIDFPDYFVRLGYPVPDFVNIPDQRLAEKAAAYFTDANARTLALYAEAKILSISGETLSDKFVRASADFREATSGAEINVNKPEYTKLAAVRTVKKVFPEYVGELYAAKYCSPATKRQVEKMVADTIAEYRNEITESSVLDEWTRQRAIEKLEAMTAKVAYPEEWTDWTSTAEIRNYADGGTYFDNCREAMRSRIETAKNLIGKKRDEKQWQVPVYTANAFNMPHLNEIVIPAGILQPPFYEPLKPEAANLGGIGVVIAHEISHAFDSNGAKYDARGHVRNWWSKDDAGRFAERCAKIKTFYDGYDIAPGVKSSGTLTLGENVADLAGLDCALALLAKTKEPDYRTFFLAFAANFRQSATKQETVWLATRDVHSVGVVRVNRAVANRSEFRKAFGVMPGDAMYVKSEDCVTVWGK
jgi:putative endopeptidase